MPSQFREAVNRLDAVIRRIGESRDRFAERQEQGDFVVFATPGAAPSTTATSVEMVPAPVEPAPAAPAIPEPAARR